MGPGLGPESSARSMTLQIHDQPLEPRVAGADLCFRKARVTECSVAIAVRCEGLVKRYSDVVAVDGLSLEVLNLRIEPGEVYGLLGPNGAGKTTTIEILEGLLDPDAGTVEVLGLRWRTDERELRQRLGIQLQETQLSDKLSVRETVRLFRSFYERGRDVEEVISLVALESKRASWVSKLSGGQKQRLAVACALVGDPDLLFLDEPTTGLDPQSRRQLWDLLAEFRHRSGTIVITTHYMDEAQVLCDRVAIIDLGRVIALGSPRELIASLGAEHVIEFAPAVGDVPPPPDRLRQLPGVCDVRVSAGVVSLSVTELHTVLPELLAVLEEAGVKLSMLTTHSASLEDVFVKLTGRHLRDA